MKLHLRHITSSEPLCLLPAKEGAAYAPGQAMTLSADGALPGAVKPEYLCMGPAREGQVPAMRVTGDMEFSAPLTADGAALRPGDKVTIAEDFSGVTAATTGGIAEILGFSTDEKAVGDQVYIKF